MSRKGTYQKGGGEGTGAVVRVQKPIWNKEVARRHIGHPPISRVSRRGDCCQGIILRAGPGSYLRARSKITYHFGRRCIPSGCVAKSRNIQIFLRFYALSAGRLNAQNHQLIFSRALSPAELVLFASMRRIHGFKIFPLTADLFQPTVPHSSRPQIRLTAYRSAIVTQPVHSPKPIF